MKITLTAALLFLDESKAYRSAYHHIKAHAFVLHKVRGSKRSKTTMLSGQRLMQFPYLVRYVRNLSPAVAMHQNATPKPRTIAMRTLSAAAS